MPLTTIYQQAWAVVKTTTGAFKQPKYNRTGPPSFGTDPVDTDYPKIGWSEENKITAAAGPGGQNVLDTSTGDWSVGGVRVYAFGTEEGKPSAPTSQTGGFYDATAGRARVSYKFNASSWTADTAFYYPLLFLDPGYFIRIAADFDSASGDPRPFFRVNVMYSTWSASVDKWVQADGTLGIRSTSRQFLRATYVDTWYELIIEWQCGTMQGDWDNVLPDGEFTVSLRNISANSTEELCHVTSIALYSQKYWEVPHHQAQEVWLGYYGLFGQSTNLIIESGVAEPPPPETEVLLKNSAIGLTWVEFTPKGET